MSPAATYIAAQPELMSAPPMMNRHFARVIITACCAVASAPGAVLAAAGRPTPNKFPASILQLAPRFHHAVVADLLHHRVYLFANNRGVPRLVARFHAAIGKDGAGKQAKGDLRTPIGIYRITHYIDGARLPDRYGIGALPINYPNALDRALGHTGSGIWLHGAAGAPRPSAGCVVLANDDFAALRNHVSPRVTPVILTASIHWISQARRDGLLRSILSRIHAWRRSWEAIDTERLLSCYSKNFRNYDGKDKAAFSAEKKRVDAAKTHIAVRLDQLSIFRLPSQPHTVQVTFNQYYKSNNFDSLIGKIQYWRRSAQGRWTIVRVHEGAPRGPSAANARSG